MVMNDSQENQHLLNNVNIVKIDNDYRFKCFSMFFLVIIFISQVLIWYYFYYTNKKVNYILGSVNETDIKIYIDKVKHLINYVCDAEKICD